MLIFGNNVYQMLTKQHIEKNSSTLKKLKVFRKKTQGILEKTDRTGNFTCKWFPVWL